jgi:hypothetical protein
MLKVNSKEVKVGDYIDLYLIIADGGFGNTFEVGTVRIGYNYPDIDDMRVVNSDRDFHLMWQPEEVKLIGRVKSQRSNDIILLHT